MAPICYDKGKRGETMDTREIIQTSAAYIDGHLKDPLSAESLAAMAGFSPYYFCRLFSLYMDMPVMEYVRHRRLAYAAKEICEGKRILDAAMDYGFESHNGFTKAFRKVYGYSPDEYRRRVSPHRPIAPNPLREHKGGFSVRPEVRIEQRHGFYVAGMVLQTSDTVSSIAQQPALWNRMWLAEQDNKIYAMARPRQHGEYYFSVPTENHLFRLMTGVKVEEPGAVDDGLWVDRVPGGLYGVFSTPPTEGDLAQAVVDTWHYIFEVWLPNSEYALNPQGLDYEFYDERCHGAPYSMDICIPLLPKGETTCLNSSLI